MRMLSSLTILLPGYIFLAVLLSSLGWKSFPSAINKQGSISGLKFQDTSSLVDIDQRVTAPPQFRVQRAEFFDIASIVALRVMVFCPSFQVDHITQRKLIDKLRRRYERGTICLTVYLDVNPQSGPQHAAFSQGIIPTALLGPTLTSRKLLGTVEINDFDFIGTPMEHVSELPHNNCATAADHVCDSENIAEPVSDGARPLHPTRGRKKLYLADLAVRPDCRRQGIASRLLAEVDSYAETNGYEEIYLHVETNNPHARSLYEKKGYVLLPPHNPARDGFTKQHLLRDPALYDMLHKTIPVASQSNSSPPPLLADDNAGQASRSTSSTITHTEAI